METREVGDLPVPGRFELQRASAEARHWIANSLAIVASILITQGRRLPQTETIPDGEVRLLFAKASARVDAVARLHRVLFARPGEPVVDIGKYLGEVIVAVREAFGEANPNVISADFRATTDLPAKEAAAVQLEQ
jgi:two-component sensor histidine kinase